MPQQCRPSPRVLLLCFQLSSSHNRGLLYDWFTAEHHRVGDHVFESSPSCCECRRRLRSHFATAPRCIISSIGCQVPWRQHQQQQRFSSSKKCCYGSRANDGSKPEHCCGCGKGAAVLSCGAGWWARCVGSPPRAKWVERRTYIPAWAWQPCVRLRSSVLEGQLPLCAAIWT